VELGAVSMPMVAQLFFGQKTVESSVHNNDFKDQLRYLPPYQVNLGKELQQ